MLLNTVGWIAEKKDMNTLHYPISVAIVYIFKHNKTIITQQQ